jgi:hypothetical protein
MSCFSQYQSSSAEKNKKAALRRLCFQALLLPGVQQNSLHPFGGVNTR